MKKQRMKGFNLLTLAQYNNLPEPDKKQYFNLVRGLDIYASKSDLQNYYTKSEIDQMISIGLKIEVVAELPTEYIRIDTIYLVPKSGEGSDNYDEYVYLADTQDWEHIGSTDVDLTNYYTKKQTDTKLSDLENEVSTKQDELVSGVNIKTINNESLLGSGDIEISLNGIDYLKDPDKTYLVIKIPADNDTFELLTGTNGSPKYTIEWGDGTSENVTGTKNPTHVYATAGMYLITISGAFENGIVYGGDPTYVNSHKIIEVYGGSNYPTSIENEAFRNCTNLTTAIFPKATDVGDRAFNNCTSLKELTLGNVTATSTGTTFENVKLTNLKIAQDVTDTDIERITTFFKANGGTFIGTETKYGLQVEKTPTADLDAVRKIDVDNLIGDIDLILDNINGEVI